jgi:hypothetical protein
MNSTFVLVHAIHSDIRQFFIVRIFVKSATVVYEFHVCPHPSLVTLVVWTYSCRFVTNYSVTTVAFGSTVAIIPVITYYIKNVRVYSMHEDKRGIHRQQLPTGICPDNQCDQGWMGSTCSQGNTSSSFTSVFLQT